MQEWKNIIQCAKKAYISHSYTDAMALNESALVLSKNEFTYFFTKEDPEKAIASVLISYFNIIDIHTIQKDTYLAILLFEEVYCFLEALSHRPNNNEMQFYAITNGIHQLNIERSLFIKNSANIITKDNLFENTNSLTFNLSNNSSNIH